MKRPNFCLFVTIIFLTLFAFGSQLSAAAPVKKFRAAFAAFACANPPFWIAKDLRVFEKYGLSVRSSRICPYRTGCAGNQTGLP